MRNVKGKMRNENPVAKVSSRLYYSFEMKVGLIYFRGPHWNNSVMHFNGDL